MEYKNNLSQLMQFTARQADAQSPTPTALQQGSTDVHSISQHLLLPAQLGEAPPLVSDTFKKPKKSANVVSSLKPAKGTNPNSKNLVVNLSNLGNFGGTHTCMKTAFGNRNHSQDHNSSKKVQFQADAQAHPGYLPTQAPGQAGPGKPTDASNRGDLPHLQTNQAPAKPLASRMTAANLRILQHNISSNSSSCYDDPITKALRQTRQSLD